jgi:chromosome segregation ATPase
LHTGTPQQVNTEVVFVYPLLVSRKLLITAYRACLYAADQEQPGDRRLFRAKKLTAQISILQYERKGNMAAMKKTKIDATIFNQACDDLYDQGRLFDRDMALNELEWAHLDQPDWQKRVKSMDAEEMADFIVSYVLDPLDEANEAFTTAEMADAE